MCIRDCFFIVRLAFFHDPDRNVLEISALERIGDGYGLDTPDDLVPFGRDEST